MLPIYNFFIVFIVFWNTLLNSVNTYNTCHLVQNCKQSTVECNNYNGKHHCICRINNRLSPTGVCLQSASVDIRCMLYQPCLNANCLLTNGRELKFNDRKKRNTDWKSLLQLVLSTNPNKLLGFCRCDKSRPLTECQYRVIGSKCTNQTDCSLASSQCTDGLCACNQTQYHSLDDCLPKKSFDEFCSDTFQCQSNLYCKSSQCRCRKYYEYDVGTGLCQYKPSVDTTDTTSNSSGNLWDDIEKLGGFVIVVVLMLFLCTRKDSEMENDPLSGSHRRRNSSTRAHRQRSSSINSHRPLTQTSSNASRNSSAYRTFEEPVPIRQTIIMPSPAQLIRSLSSSSDEGNNYNPYQFDTLFPQQSDNDDPPSYEDVVKDMDKH